MIKNLSDNKIYIGSSKKIERRWTEHKNLLKHNSHPNNHLQNAWNKYGSEPFEFKILIRCNFSDLPKYEKKTIDTYKNTIGWEMMYNICEDIGFELGHSVAKETIEKRNITRQKKKKEGIQYNYGHKQDSKTKTKISNSLKNKPWTLKRRMAENNKSQKAKDKQRSNSKLTRKQVKEIRKKYNAGVNKNNLANQYQVNERIIRDLINYRTYKYK